jgi:large subunit ribosomal protein L24
VKERMKIRKGDTVKVLSGNDKGKTGEVLEVIPKTEKIVVKGVNVRKKHVKARKQGEESGIISVECAIHSSKVNVVCPKCGKAVKVGYKMEKDEKVRVCRKCGAKLK